jgi:hypothetical protein
MPCDQLEAENELRAREAREKENAEAIARSQASTSSEPMSEQSFMQYMQLVKKSKISICTISCHKTVNKDEIMEDEE